MPVIESIRRSSSISTVNFDDGTSIRCTSNFVRRSNIARGQLIDPVFVDRLRQSAEFDLAYSQAERLNRRGRMSRREIAVRLQQTGIQEAQIAAALDQLHQRGDLDDEVVALELTRRNLGRELNRNPDLSWRQFRSAQGRRLALRGFGQAATAAALKQAWSEQHESSLARGR